jgi:hypothetical protein
MDDAAPRKDNTNIKWLHVIKATDKPSRPVKRPPATRTPSV